VKHQGSLAFDGVLQDFIQHSFHSVNLELNEIEILTLLRGDVSNSCRHGGKPFDNSDRGSAVMHHGIHHVAHRCELFGTDALLLMLFDLRHHVIEVLRKRLKFVARLHLND
jgi:hypothetical protein